ncbi:hypothetical protein MKW98_005240 [Papaver atlanticum]|uniref:Uncharacterized protein n=1 Tax=Papaver atlanticum TaxID=357466 RepID=A0AAD4RWA9_9MAGN|nr:hypothetical protein MKW98_005240 [Papaver atlanticum]
MGAKNSRSFIWMVVIVALLFMSSEVSAVKDLSDNTKVETAEKNGVKDHEYGASLAGIRCGKKKCCVKQSDGITSYCVECCK